MCNSFFQRQSAIIQAYAQLQEIESQADARHCFTEADAREIGTERHW